MSGSIMGSQFQDGEAADARRATMSEPRLTTGRRFIEDNSQAQVTPEQDEKISKSRESLVNRPKKGKQLRSPIIKSKATSDMDFDGPAGTSTVVARSTSNAMFKGSAKVNKSSSYSGNSSNGFLTESSNESNNSNRPVRAHKARGQPVPRPVKPPVTSKLANGLPASSHSTVTIRGVEMKKYSAPASANPIPMQSTTSKGKTTNSKLKKKPASETITGAGASTSDTSGPNVPNGDSKKFTKDSSIIPKPTKPKAVPSVATGLSKQTPASGIPTLNTSNSDPKNQSTSSNAEEAPRNESTQKVDEVEKQQPYFKSQFWSYVDPKKYPPKDQAPKKDEKDEKERPYDPTEVKSFMEKQKEIRILKKKHDMAERQMEIERKQLQLRELESKRREIFAKVSNIPRKTAPSDFALAQSQKPHCSKTTVPSKIQSKAKRPIESLVKQVLKRTIEGPARPRRLLDNDTNEHSAKMEAEANLRTKLLLQEFETIMHDECLSVLKQHTDKLNSNEAAYRSPRKPAKLCQDKAVETTLSLFEDDSESVSTYKSHPMYVKTAFNGPKRVASDSFDIRNKAAAKIQAAYRSYRIRKVWHEVNEWRDTQRPKRRISFYRVKAGSASLGQNSTSTPDRPFVNKRSSTTGPRKLAALSMSPAVASPVVDPFRPGRTFFDIKMDFSTYIPAPKGFTDNSARTSSSLSSSGTDPTRSVHLLGVPPSPALGIKGAPTPARFEEPFPREAIKQLLQQTPKPHGNDGMGIPRRSVGSNGYAPSNKVSDRRLSIDVNSLAPVPKEPKDPTFYTVLKEQIRLLQEKVEVEKEQSEVLHRPKSSSHLEQEYDSDSTRHGSIQNGRSTTSLSITDDYIGPDQEAMKQAYHIRRSARLSLEPEQRQQAPELPCLDNILSISPVGRRRILRDPDISIGSTTTVETDDELKDSEIQRTKSRPRIPPPAESTTETSYDVCGNDLPLPLRRLQNQVDQERLQVLEAAHKFNMDTALLNQRTEQEIRQKQMIQEDITQARYKQILAELQTVKETVKAVQIANYNKALIQNANEAISSISKLDTSPSAEPDVAPKDMKGSEPLSTDHSLQKLESDLKEISNETERFAEPDTALNDEGYAELSVKTAENETTATPEQVLLEFQARRKTLEAEHAAYTNSLFLQGINVLPTVSSRIPESFKEAEVGFKPLHDVEIQVSESKENKKETEVESSQIESFEVDHRESVKLEEEIFPPQDVIQNELIGKTLDIPEKVLPLEPIRPELEALKKAIAAAESEISNTGLPHKVPEQSSSVESESSSFRTPDIDFKDTEYKALESILHETEFQTEVEEISSESENVAEPQPIQDVTRRNEEPSDKSFEIPETSAYVEPAPPELEIVDVDEKVEAVDNDTSVSLLPTPDPELEFELKDVEYRTLESILSEEEVESGLDEISSSTESFVEPEPTSDVMRIEEPSNKTFEIPEKSTYHEPVPPSLESVEKTVESVKVDDCVYPGPTPTPQFGLKGVGDRTIESILNKEELQNELKELDESENRTDEGAAFPHDHAKNQLNDQTFLVCERSVSPEQTGEQFQRYEGTLTTEHEKNTEELQSYEGTTSPVQTAEFKLSKSESSCFSEPEIVLKDVETVQELGVDDLQSELKENLSETEKGFVEQNTVINVEELDELNDKTFAIPEGAAFSDTGNMNLYQFQVMQNEEEMFPKSGDDQDEDEEWFEDELVSAPVEDGKLKQEAAKIIEESRRIESEIRELEALQVKASSTKVDVPAKPPPPYVPPPAVQPAESTIPAQPAFLVSCEEQKLIFLIDCRVNAIWDTWVDTGTYRVESSKQPSSNGGSSASTSLSFDFCVKDVIEEVIQEVLQYEPGASLQTRAYDKLRLGALTLQAQKQKLPKTKEELSRAVLERVITLVPPELLVRKKNSSITGEGGMWRKKMKWAARPRDLVDEALVEELIDEDRLWLETGPEEVDVMENLCKSVIKKAVQQVLESYKAISERHEKCDQLV